LGYKKIKYLIEDEILLIKYLSRVHGFSNKKMQQYTSKNRIYLNSEVVKKPNIIAKGVLEIVEFVPDAIGLEPIFETDELCFFDKPSGMIVHPVSKQTDYTLLDEIYTYLDGTGYLGHRLDKETSGLVVVSKSKEIDIKIKSLFENRKIYKEYLAIIRGKLDTTVIVDKPLKTNIEHTKIKDKVIVADDGQVAKTKIVPLKYNQQDNTTLVKAIPHTGRTHQIRVHLYSIGHSIVGEPIYGVDFDIAEAYLDGKLSDKDRIKHTGASRLMLHSHRLEFELNQKYNIKSEFDCAIYK
jgi:23S rRNA pseudouridine1911/1915/1917 synthase